MILQFRCRRCNELFALGEHMPSETALHYLKYAAAYPNDEKIMMTNRCQYHQCADGGLGYGEFVGTDPSAAASPPFKLI